MECRIIDQLEVTWKEVDVAWSTYYPGIGFETGVRYEETCQVVVY
jgi:hypothetical protein